MRFIHTSDWHLGRTVGQWSLLEEQRDFLGWLVEQLRVTEADALLVAGDVYDRAVPPAEAVELLDWFLWRVRSELGVPVLMAAGNHDSPRRLAFAGNLLRREGVFIEGALSRRRPAPFGRRRPYAELTARWRPYLRQTRRQRAAATCFWPMAFLRIRAGRGSFCAGTRRFGPAAAR